VSRLKEKLGQNKPVITAEIAPPKGAGLKKLLRHTELLAPHVDAINITDCQRALVKMSSLAASRVLLDHGAEPVLQLTCRDRNSIALQSDLMGASALGIRNLLCLTGDPVKVGDSRQSKSVFEVESLALLNIVQKLQSGRDQNDLKMNAPTQFFVGAVVNPSLDHGISQLQRMAKKVEAGAQFFQTQANYDLEGFKHFLNESKTLNTNIIAGILILPNAKVAKFIHENIPGIRMPDSIINRFFDAKNEKDELEVGIQIAVEMMRGLQTLCQGFHLMTIRQEELIPQVLERYHGG